MDLSEIKEIAAEHITKAKDKCPICGGTGYIEWTENGYDFAKECECLKAERDKEKQEKYIASSGLEVIFETYNFKTYKADDKATEGVKKAALDYVEHFKNYWWFISGNSGCGKTHITSAICKKLIDKGNRLYYMKWREESTTLKGMVNDSKYADAIGKIKRVPVLYIDDLFKGSVTDADIKLAFEIINERYVNRMSTLFSSERSINEIAEIDEAIAGRINERAQQYALNIKSIGNRRM